MESNVDSIFLIPIGEYKDNIKFDLESRIGGRRLHSSGSGQQNVMDFFKFLGYPKKNH